MWMTPPLRHGVRRHPLAGDGLDRWPQQGALPCSGKQVLEAAGTRTRACLDAPPRSPALRTLTDITPRRDAQRPQRRGEECRVGDHDTEGRPLSSHGVPRGMPHEGRPFISSQRQGKRARVGR